MGYSLDCPWRNRAEFPPRHKEIIEFLAHTWNKEVDYRLIKELWPSDGNRIQRGTGDESSEVNFVRDQGTRKKGSGYNMKNLLCWDLLHRGDLVITLAYKLCIADHDAEQTVRPPV